MFDEDNAKEIMNYIQWHSGTLRFLAIQIRPYRDKSKIYDLNEQRAILRTLADRYQLSKPLNLKNNQAIDREARAILSYAVQDYWKGHEKELTAAGGLDRPLVEGEAACIADLTVERLRKEFNINEKIPERFRFHSITEEMLDTWKPKDIAAYVAMSAETAKGVKETIIGKEKLHGDLEFSDPTQTPEVHEESLTEGEKKVLDNLLERVLYTGDLTPVMAHILPIENNTPPYTKEEQNQILDSLPVSKDIRNTRNPEKIFRQAMWVGRTEDDFPYKNEGEGYTLDYTDHKEEIPPLAERLVKDLTTTYLLKEFNMSNPLNDPWKPASIYKTMTAEELGTIIRLGRDTARWIKDHYIPRELRHPDREFTDPIRDYVIQEKIDDLKKEASLPSRLPVLNFVKDSFAPMFQKYPKEMKMYWSFIETTHGVKILERYREERNELAEKQDSQESPKQTLLRVTDAYVKEEMKSATEFPSELADLHWAQKAKQMQHAIHRLIHTMKEQDLGKMVATITAEMYIQDREKSGKAPEIHSFESASNYRYTLDKKWIERFKPIWEKEPETRGKSPEQIIPGYEEYTKKNIIFNGTYGPRSSYELLEEASGIKDVLQKMRWNEYLKKEPEIIKETTKGDRTMETKETMNKEQKIVPTKNRMQYSRRPALYKETSELIHRMADEVLKSGTIEPLVDRFSRSENPVSRTQYRAVNAMVLREKAREMEYMDDRWITFNQAKAYSLHLNKGEKGVIITHYGIATQKEIDAMQKRTDRWNEAHPDEKKTITLKPGQRFAKDYFVYNAEQFSAFPPKTPEYTKEEQAKILSKIHEVTRGEDTPLPEKTLPREILQEGIAHIMYGENSPLQNAQINMAERMMISELASGMLQKELNIRTPIRPDSYDVNIVRDDELGKEAFDRIREKPTRIVAYLNMAETLIDQVKDRVIGRDLLHQEIPFSERMQTVDRSYNKEERIEYAKGKEAGLNKWEIEAYMKPEIQEKWPKYRESFAQIKESTQKSMDRIRESMKMTPIDKATVTCEAPRTLLEKIRTAERKLSGRPDGKDAHYKDPAQYLQDFKIKDKTFTFTMKAREKDPILAACDHRYELRFAVENTFRDRRLRDLQKQIARDVDIARNPEKAKTKDRSQDKSMERTR